MKAVYEMPRVSFEEFTPNVAIANCSGDGEYKFDCLKGSNADNANLISSAMGVTCNNDCGFADYTGDKYTTGDTNNADYTTTGSTSVLFKGNSHSRFNSTLSWDTYTYQTGSIDLDFIRIPTYDTDGRVTATGANFMGWLYIGRNNNNSYSKVTTSIVNGFLKLTSDAMHLLLAPIYGTKASDVQMS